MEMNNSESNAPSKPRRGNRDEIWKEQIRLAIEESKRNIEQQQAAQQAPEYRITLNAPEVTKSYYDKIRSEEIGRRREKHSKHHAKSESEISKKRERPGSGTARDRAMHSNGHIHRPSPSLAGDAGRFRRPTSGGNVASTSSRYSAWPKRSISQQKWRRNVKGRSTKSSVETLASETGSEPSGFESDYPRESQFPSTVASSTGGETGEVLSYFDPNYVKTEFKEIMAKSRNIVIGPPREILEKYFGYTDEDQIPEELQFDDTPKAFILPKKLWRDYDDSAAVEEPTAEVSQSTPKTLTNKRTLKRMEEEKEAEPNIPKQSKPFSVEFIAQRPFKRFGMLGSNLNDASLGMMDDLDLNVDSGGPLHKDKTDTKFKFSEDTETPVEADSKEDPLRHKKHPSHADGRAQGADPQHLKKSLKSTTGEDKESPRGTSSKPRGEGKGERKHEPSESDLDGRRKHPGRKGKARDSSSSSSSGSSSGGYSCTCGETSSSSGSTSEESGSSSSGDGERKSKSRRKKKHRKHEDEEEEGEEEGPSKKDIGIDATIPDGPVPPWTPASWKSPEGWIYKKKVDSHYPPNTTLEFLGDSGDNRVNGSEWLRAFGAVRKAEKDGDIEKLRDIIGREEGEDDLLNLEEPEPELETSGEEEEEDPMERLPRGDIPSARTYPEFPLPEHFKYYRSYPLYPTISSERYFEWYKDVDRLANPMGSRRFNRPAGFSKSMGHINWDDPREAAKWYAYGYRRPDTKPKPERIDYNTKDYIYDNARSIMLMPPRKVIPKYIDDRKGTSHLLEPSGLVKKFIFRGDFGKVPEYLMGRNEELGRPAYPDMDKFYRPHRCKYLHGHVHCKICMRPHPTIKSMTTQHCDMTPSDYQHALDYRNSRSKPLQSNYTSATHYSYSARSHKKGDREYDIESILSEVGLGDEYRRSKATRGNQNLKTVQSSAVSNPASVMLPPVYV